jgi:hypothetical protein
VHVFAWPSGIPDQFNKFNLMDFATRVFGSIGYTICERQLAMFSIAQIRSWMRDNKPANSSKLVTLKIINQLFKHDLGYILCPIIYSTLMLLSYQKSWPTCQA